MVGLSVAGGIARLTLTRPKALNALDGATVRSFGERLAELRGRQDVRVVVTRGEGSSFCAGSDLREIASMSPAEAAASERAAAETFSLLDSLPQPTIAVLHGYALGGGLALALYHDFRIASETAVLAMPEVELGWPPAWGMGRLVETVGPAQAGWLAMAGTRVSGAEAKAMGLVNDVAPEGRLGERVEALARRLADLPVAGVRSAKELVLLMSRLRDPAWDALAVEAFRCCYDTDDARGLVAAFVARRRSTG